MSVPVVQFVYGGQPAAAEIPNAEYTVVYDGNCKVCTRMAGLLRDWDGGQRLLVISSQTPGVKERFAWIPEKNYAEALQVIAADGRAFQGARGIEEILDVLPKGRLLSWVFDIPFARGLIEGFYRWFARNRYRLGCGDHCSYRPKSA